MNRTWDGSFDKFGGGPLRIQESEFFEDKCGLASRRLPTNVGFIFALSGFPFFRLHSIVSMSSTGFLTVFCSFEGYIRFLGGCSVMMVAVASRRILPATGQFSPDDLVWGERIEMGHDDRGR
jgi:hypothetical protein